MKIRLITIPNLITLCNLLCGVVALRYIFIDNDLVTAFWLVIAAAIFDFFDGFVARLLKSHSAVGKELDSLADMVSFGVVPSAVVYSVLTSLGVAQGIAAISAVIALCSALRLAKFNIDENQSSEFIGMPTPANTIFFVSAGWLIQKGSLAIDNEWIILIITVFMSWLLISPIRMFALKFKNFTLKDNKIRYGFIVGSAIGVALFQIAAIPVIIIAYILISAVSNLACPRKA